LHKYTDRYMLHSEISERQKEQLLRIEKMKQERLKKEERQRQKRKRHKRSIIFVASFCSICLGIVVFVNAQSRRVLIEEKAAVEKQLDSLKYKTESLREELSMVESDEYVEQQARSELRMVYPGEMIYVLQENDDDEKTKEGSLKP